MQKLFSKKFVGSITAVISMLLVLSVAQADGLSGIPFDPDYPAGPSYDTFSATLEGFGLVSDADGDGIQNDRCSADGEATQQIVLGTEKVALAIASNVCDADPEPISKAVCFGVNLALEELVVATEINIAQCDHQDGSVNAAEIEAGFENTVTLLDDLFIHDANLDQHDTDIKIILSRMEGKIDELILLVQTPEGKRPLWPVKR